MAQGILYECGLVEGQAAHSLFLRTGHGVQYLADHFQKRIKAWRSPPASPSRSGPGQAGRQRGLSRTLKKQVICGRTCEDLEEVGWKGAEFVELYTNQWIMEKNGQLRA